MENTFQPLEGEANIQNITQQICDLPSSDLKAVFDCHIPADLAPASSFWLTYSETEVYIGLRACLLAWVVTGYKIVPREFQLKATIAMMTGKDSLVDVGTGYGKTLCMVLPCLLAPQDMVIIFSPLKRLQAVHVSEFTKYGIKTIAINEDTPNDPTLWKKIRAGSFTALFVQPEQVFMLDGHLPRLARLIQERPFVKMIKRFFVDEAHFIYSAGTAQYGLPAFREAWGRLGELRIKLGRLRVPVQALSGTQPPHIKTCIKESLLFGASETLSVKLTSNRPNIVYATHQIAGQLSDFRNLDFVIPNDCFPQVRLPKTIIFHDDSEECADAALYMDRRLHPSSRNKGIVCHYHGKMSIEYLTMVYDDFSRSDGVCRILHATSGASTACGLDIPDIEAVIQYGITRDVPSTLQRGGRGGRNSHGQAIFLILYEPWVLKIDLSGIKQDMSTTDPDFPNTEKLTKHSTKQQRTGQAMITLIQSQEECIRGFFAKYLDDKSDDSKSKSVNVNLNVNAQYLVLALNFTGQFCCDKHPENEFSISHFFGGQLLYEDGGRLFYGSEYDYARKDATSSTNTKRALPKKTRKTIDRPELKSQLLIWRAEAHLHDSLAFRPPTFILDDKSIKILTALHPNKIKDTTQLVFALKETAEWGQEWSQQILAVILAYDRELEDAKKAAVTSKKAQQKKRRVEMNVSAFQQETDRIRVETERRLQESISQGSSRFANTVRQ